jgi:uncharacterized protein YciI
MAVAWTDLHADSAGGRWSAFGGNSLRWPRAAGPLRVAAPGLELVHVAPHHPPNQSRLAAAGQNPPMPWFIKTETIRVPHAEVVPHLQAHRAWVGRLRRQGVRISSGYLVDGDGRPGGGGLLLLEASDHAAAEALIRQDPMLTSGSVDWRLHQWIGAVGDLGVG